MQISLLMTKIQMHQSGMGDGLLVGAHGTSRPIGRRQGAPEAARVPVPRLNAKEPAQIKRSMITLSSSFSLPKLIDEQGTGPSTTDDLIQSSQISNASTRPNGRTGPS